jgi:uncharacterized protein (DUF362 family)
MGAMKRRTFLEAGLLAAVAAGTPGCAGTGTVAAGPVPSAPARPGARVAIVGVRRNAPEAELALAVRDAALAATDFTWLRPGDRVLLKVASNSANLYPATTHPVAVSAMTALLRDRGAAVVVGDQSGVQHVHHTRAKQRGSTHASFRNNGIERAALASGAELMAFEEAGYDGYMAAMPADGHFRREIFLPRVLGEVDHVVVLPRLSRHCLAGSTLGLKAAVGWLREDSRLDLHREDATFLEKCADINAAPPLCDRLRLVLSVGTRLQTTVGPDVGWVAEPEVGLVLASEHIVDHDLAALAYLLEMVQHETPWVQQALDPYPGLSSMLNRLFVLWVWGADAVSGMEGYTAPRLNSPWDCRVLTRGCAILGGRPTELVLDPVENSVPAALLDAIKRRATG